MEVATIEETNNSDMAGGSGERMAAIERTTVVKTTTITTRITKNVASVSDSASPDHPETTHTVTIRKEPPVVRERRDVELITDPKVLRETFAIEPSEVNDIDEQLQRIINKTVTVHRTRTEHDDTPARVVVTTTVTRHAPDATHDMRTASKTTTITTDSHQTPRTNELIDDDVMYDNVPEDDHQLRYTEMETTLVDRGDYSQELMYTELDTSSVDARTETKNVDYDDVPNGGHPETTTTETLEHEEDGSRRVTMKTTVVTTTMRSTTAHDQPTVSTPPSSPEPPLPETFVTETFNLERNDNVRHEFVECNRQQDRNENEHFETITKTVDICKEVPDYEEIADDHAETIIATQPATAVIQRTVHIEHNLATEQIQQHEVHSTPSTVVENILRYEEIPTKTFDDDTTTQQSITKSIAFQKPSESADVSRQVVHVRPNEQRQFGAFVTTTTTTTTTRSARELASPDYAEIANDDENDSDEVRRLADAMASGKPEMTENLLWPTHNANTCIRHERLDDDTHECEQIERRSWDIETVTTSHTTTTRRNPQVSPPDSNRDGTPRRRPLSVQSQDLITQGRGPAAPVHQCVACGLNITAACVTAMAPNSGAARKFHPTCFVCSYCLKPLNTRGTYKEHQKKPYCHECFYRLYSGLIYSFDDKMRPL